MTGCSFSNPYAISLLVEHLHNVPRVDAQFKDVNDAFAPNSGQYLESLGFWAVVLAVLGGILFLVLMLCVCKVRFCRFDSVRGERVEAAEVKRSILCVGVQLLLTALCVSALLYGCIQSNLVFEDTTDNLQQANEELLSSKQQTLDSNDLLIEEVNSHLGILLLRVQDNGNSSQEQAVSKAMAIAGRMDAKLDDVESTLETAELASVVHTGDSLKNIWLYCSVAIVLWFAVLVVLGFMSLAFTRHCLLNLTMICVGITIVIAFAAAGISFAISLGMSDFCINPDENTITYLSDSKEAGNLRNVRRSVTNSSFAQYSSSVTSLPYVLSPSPVARAIRHSLLPSISTSMSHVFSTAFDEATGYMCTCTTVHLSSSIQPTVVTSSSQSSMMTNSLFVNFDASIDHTLQDASWLAMPVSNTQVSDDSTSVSMEKTSAVTRQYGPSDKTRVYCPNSTSLMLVSTVSPTPATASDVWVYVTTATPTYATNVTVTVEPATASGPVSDSVISFYVYCSDTCGDPFAEDLLAAKNELYHLRSSLERLRIDLLSISGSETLIASALDGVVSVNTSMLILEEKVQCDDLHKLYTNARDSACDKGIVSLFTMVCASFMIGVLFLPLFVCLRWMNVRRRNYNQLKGVQSGSYPTSDLNFVNDAPSASAVRRQPPDRSLDPPPYSSLSGREAVQYPLSGCRPPSVQGQVLLNYGCNMSPPGQAIEQYELSHMRFELGLDGSH